MSDVAKDFISKLLIKDKTKRLGALGRGEEVLAHPFFKDINLEKLLQKQIKAPFLPKCPEPEEMRKEQNKGEVVRLKELQESVIPE